jgi:RNA polymerase sigma-70 factor, ECF subfamily
MVGMDEDALIEKSKKGEEDAFSELVKLNQSKIFQMLLGMIKDEKVAQDLTQEAFISAFRHIDSFKKHSSFYTWVYRIAYNLALDFLRKKARLKEDEFKENFIQIAPASEETDFTAQLEDALKLLSDKQRVVFELYYLKKMAQKEIAVLLNIPEGTVRSRIYSGKKKLQKVAFFRNLLL